jgi:hypothetical protein
VLFAVVSGRQVLSGPFMYSAFCLPFLILAIVAGIAFIALAWGKSSRNRQAFLVLYVIAMIVYWMAMVQSSPW